MVGRDPLKSLAELDKACLSSPFPFLPPIFTNQTLLSLARALPFVHPSASRPRQPGIPAWKRVTTSYLPRDPTLVLFPCRLPLSYGSSLPLFRHFQASLLRSRCGPALAVGAHPPSAGSQGHKGSRVTSASPQVAAALSEEETDYCPIRGDTAHSTRTKKTNTTPPPRIYLFRSF